MPGPGSYFFGEEEKREVLDVLESGYMVRYGDEKDPNFKRKVATFEKEFSEFMGLKHSIALNSGTSAILIGLSALGIGPGDEVIVPGYTFIASISAIFYARAIPVLAEVDNSLTINPDDIEKKITSKTKAIIPVHMLGNPCDMDAIMKIAKKHNLAVVEDCCQAVGGVYKNKRLGTFGDMGAYSLNWYKIITTGDGGAIGTNDDKLYEKAFGLHDQGHRPLRFGLEVGNRGIIGLNFRINELTGAVALAQLRKLNKIISILQKNKISYTLSIFFPSMLIQFSLCSKGNLPDFFFLVFCDVLWSMAFQYFKDYILCPLPHIFSTGICHPLIPVASIWQSWFPPLAASATF